MLYSSSLGIPNISTTAKCINAHWESAIKKRMSYNDEAASPAGASSLLGQFLCLEVCWLLLAADILHPVRVYARVCVCVCVCVRARGRVCVCEGLGYRDPQARSQDLKFFAPPPPCTHTHTHTHTHSLIHTHTHTHTHTHALTYTHTHTPQSARR